MNITLIITFLIIGLIVTSIIFLVSNSGQSKKKDRVKSLIANRGATTYDQADTAHHKTDNKKKSGKKDQNIAKKLKVAAKAAPIASLKKTSIRSMIMQAGMAMPVYQFWLLSVLSCLLVFGVTQALGLSKLVTVLLTFFGFFGLPRFILKTKVNKRQRKFLEDFADALEAMTRLLKSGMPITEAISMVAREYPDPIGTEMARVYEAQKIGDTLPQAVTNLAERVPLPEVQMFATSVIIQTQTGSSLSEVLSNLANVIRQRYRLKRKVQALSSEAKISAMIIGALPCVVMLAMYFINREYLMILFDTPRGNTLLYMSVGWMMIGVLVMRQMINFKV